MNLQFIDIVKRTVSSLMAALLLITAGVVMAADSATVQSVSGYVTTLSDNGEKKRLKSGDQLDEGQTVYTGENSSALLLLSNGQTITLAPLSSYAIGEKIVGNGISGGTGSVSSTPASPTLSTATSAGGSPVN